MPSARVLSIRLAHAAHSKSRYQKNLRRRFASPPPPLPVSVPPRSQRSFKGLVPTIISGAPYTGIQMTTYELLKRASPGGGEGVFWNLVNGAVCGLIAQTVTYPGDTVRRRMQNNGAGGAARIYTTSWDCAVKMMRNEGIPGFFKGGWTNTVRAVPGAAIQFASYEAMKRLLNC